jgi:hypothetical protein
MWVGGSGTRTRRLVRFLVDRAVARRPAVGRTEFARAFLASKAIARRIHARLPVSSMGVRDNGSRQVYTRLHVWQATRALVHFPNTEPWLPAAVSFDPDALYRN